jgi:crotonobetainyl-CoA:carnitine CoA-transferase CaiB-like acyl-CoA transferase
MAGILRGLKVIAMEHMEAIPAASVWMADWGAEVIRVEPLTGDMWRGARRVRGTFRTIKLDGAEADWGIQLLNRNKKGLAINLKTKPGIEILYKLIEKADVFMSNYQFDTLEKLKLDYTSLSQINPRLVYAFFSGYGTVGPDKEQRGFDNAAGWARSGMMYMTGEPGSPPPKVRGGVMDRTAAPHVVAGVLAALLHREKTGKGQELEVSLFHSAVWTLALDIQGALVGSPMPKDDRTKAQNPIWNSYRTKDDRWFQLAMLQSDLSWPDFCKAIERPKLENDPRFKDMEARRENCEELIRIIDEVLASKTMDEWDRRFREHNCIYGRVQSPAEVINDPQALANDFFVDLPHPAGKFKVVATPVKFRQNPASVKTAAPEVGQHNEEILLEMGYSWDDIAQLKEQGVIL